MLARLRVLTLLGVTALSLAVLGVAPAASTHPSGEAPIHPGVQTVTGGAQCTANFLFTDGEDLFLGQAAHCSGVGELARTNPDGCRATSRPLGTPVQIEGASQPGTLAYSSWITMQDVGETAAAPCMFNDVALVRIAEADEGRVSPSLPVSGGPDGVETGGIRLRDRVYMYGASGLGVQKGTPRPGVTLGTSAGGWTHLIAAVPPGIPGDSGAPVVTGSGDALGIVSTVTLAPAAGTNSVTDLNLALEYMATHAAASGAQFDASAITLVEGTEPFTPPGVTDGILGGGLDGVLGGGLGGVLDGALRGGPLGLL